MGIIGLLFYNLPGKREHKTQWNKELKRCQVFELIKIQH